tara:strand:+ start:458 stop:631 length:174 start_codon:yes stop_codon:yes gene_type:complete
MGGLFKWVASIFNSNSNTEELETIRTRDSKGRFIKDDPDTPENEAFTTRKKKRKKNG